MSNPNLYQPTAEELDALWEKGNKRETPCDAHGCAICRQLRSRRMAALTQILAKAQMAAQGSLPYPQEVMCMFCHNKTPAGTAHLYQGDWIGDCCWDERLRTTA